MNRIGITIALASTLLVAPMATAQMMGGGNHGGSSPRNGSRPFGGMTRGTNGGMNGGSMMGDMGGGMGQSLTVGTDGVVYTLRASAAATTQIPAVEVVAIRPTGAVAWTTKIEGRMTRLTLSDSLLLVTSGSGDMGMDGWTDAEDDDVSRLIALSVTTGSVQWQLELDGFAGALEPFSGGVYALVIQHDGANSGNGMHNGSRGTTLMKRSITAIDNAGKVRWSTDLN